MYKEAYKEARAEKVMSLVANVYLWAGIPLSVLLIVALVKYVGS